MPEPPGSSCPDQLTVKTAADSVVGSAVTLLVGGPTSIVLSACLVGSMPWLGSSSLTWSVVIVVAQVEGDGRDVADLRARGQPRLGTDDVAEVALPAARAILGRQEAGEHIGRELGVRVDRVEMGIDLARGDIEAQLDLNIEGLAVVGHRDRGREVLAPARDRDVRVAEPDLCELERGPVEVRVELVGDINLLGRGGCGGRVLEVHAIGEGLIRRDESLRAVAARADERVGVDGRGGTGAGSVSGSCSGGLLSPSPSPGNGVCTRRGTPCAVPVPVAISRAHAPVSVPAARPVARCRCPCLRCAGTGSRTAWATMLKVAWHSTANGAANASPNDAVHPLAANFADYRPPATPMVMPIGPAGNPIAAPTAIPTRGRTRCDSPSGKPSCVAPIVLAGFWRHSPWTQIVRPQDPGIVPSP